MSIKTPATPSEPSSKNTTSSTGSGHNYLYALTTWQESKTSVDVIMGMLQIFSRDIYILFDPKPTQYYVTPYVEVIFGFDPEDIFESFSLSTLVGDSVIAR